MNRKHFFRNTSWLIIFSFISQLVIGEVIRSDSQPRAAGTPAISGEVVRSDSQPRTSGAPAISGEVVRSDSQPRTSNVPAVSPLVGEVAVGVSLLIAYGPQILALAATVATLAAAVSTVVNTSKSSLILIKSIGEKLQRMLKMLLGPLSISSDMAQDGVGQLSSHLLETARFVTKSLSTPVSDVQGKINLSLDTARDLENLTAKGQKLSEMMKREAADTQSEIGNVVAGGEVQLLRDGALNVAKSLSERADVSATAFNQTNTNAKMTIKALEQISAQVEEAVSKAGAGNDATLQEIGLSGAEIGKKLIDSRKLTVMSNRSLNASRQSIGSLHQELLDLLTDVKTELELYAHENGVSREKLDEMVKSPQIKNMFAIRASTGEVSASQHGASNNRDLSGEIGLMIDDLAKISQNTSKKLAEAEADKSAARTADGMSNASNLYQQVVSAYKNYIAVMTRNPDDADAIGKARANYEKLQSQYKQAIGE